MTRFLAKIFEISQQQIKKLEISFAFHTIVGVKHNLRIVLRLVPMGCFRSEEIELSNQASIFWPYLFQTVDRKIMKNGFNLHVINFTCNKDTEISVSQEYNWI